MELSGYPLIIYSVVSSRTDDEPDNCAGLVGGFSLHIGVANEAHQCDKLVRIEARLRIYLSGAFAALKRTDCPQQGMRERSRILSKQHTDARTETDTGLT